MSIPRRLIQTGKSSELKPTARAAVANLTLLHPDWDYLFFDDAAVSRFVTSEFPQYEPIFNGFRHPIQKFDFFRYLAVFRLGGFYFDLDVFLSESVSIRCATTIASFPSRELTLNRFLRRRHAMDSGRSVTVLLAPRQATAFSKQSSRVRSSQRDATWRAQMVNGIAGGLRSEFYVFNTTGPGLLCRTLAENREAAQEVKVLFPADVCDSETWHQLGAMAFISWTVRGGAKEVSCGDD